MRRAGFALLCALALASAGAASASYAPKFSLTVDPSTPGVPAALTASVTQASGEDATASERFHFPADFLFNPNLQVTRCRSADEQAKQCPDSSRIGSAAAETPFGPFSGNVYLTSDFRFVIFLRGVGGLIESEVSGYLLLQPDGSVIDVLDGLPNVSATKASVTLDGGPRSLFLTPRACKTYEIAASFTSHNGGKVDEQAPITIAGCDTVPRIESARVVPHRLRGRNREVRLTWRLSAPGAATAIEIQRIVRDGEFVRWKRVLTTKAGAASAANRVVLDLRRGRRALPAGEYQIVLTSLSAEGRPADVARLRLTITNRWSG